MTLKFQDKDKHLGQVLNYIKMPNFFHKDFYTTFMSEILHGWKYTK